MKRLYFYISVNHHPIIIMSASTSPTNDLVTPLLTDMYQISMAYAYWKTGKHEDFAVFDLFFRKPPFGGQYCVFAGLDEVLKFMASYRYVRMCTVFFLLLL